MLEARGYPVGSLELLLLLPQVSPQLGDLTATPSLLLKARSFWVLPLRVFPLDPKLMTKFKPHPAKCVFPKGDRRKGDERGATGELRCDSD